MSLHLLPWRHKWGRRRGLFLADNGLLLPNRLTQGMRKLHESSFFARELLHPAKRPGRGWTRVDVWAVEDRIQH